MKARFVRGMTTRSKTILFGIILLALTGCKDKAPSVRVLNQRIEKANVQFKQADGSTINHNDIVPGAYSSFQDVEEGTIEVKAVIKNEAITPQTTFDAGKDNNYTVMILTGNPPTLRVDVQSK